MSLNHFEEGKNFEVKVECMALAEGDCTGPREHKSFVGKTQGEYRDPIHQSTTFPWYHTMESLGQGSCPRRGPCRILCEKIRHQHGHHFEAKSLQMSDDMCSLIQF